MAKAHQNSRRQYFQRYLNQMPMRLHLCKKKQRYLRDASNQHAPSTIVTSFDLPLSLPRNLSDFRSTYVQSMMMLMLMLMMLLLMMLINADDAHDADDADDVDDADDADDVDDADEC